MTLISINNVGMDYGAGPLFDGVNATIARGERWAVVGRNGTGKTTLLNILTGRLEPTRGHIAIASGLRITLLDQQRGFGDATNVWRAAALSFSHLIALEHELQQQANALAAAGAAVTESALQRYDADQERFSREGGYTYAARIDAVLAGLGFDPEHAHAQPLAQLSGGELGRVALARQLASPADVLLLDEPTNHLDLDTTRWLEQYLRNLDATVLLISHDRAFLNAVTDHILHLEAGTATAYSGGYAEFVRLREERRLAQMRAYDQQQRVIAAEEDYIRRNIAGQNSRQAKGRRTRLARLPRLSPPAGEQGAMALRLEPRARGGDQVLTLRQLQIDAGARTLLSDFTALVRRGEFIGIIGANGSGKSTLLRAIAGSHEVAAGEVNVGLSTDVAYYRQDLTQVPADKTLFDIIHDLRPLWQRGQVQGHLGRFGFSGDTVQRRADTLSGGERARVALAMLMLSRANLLLLDEPTNHLDVESIEALEDALADYEGTVLLVSHDRALLDALADRVWSLEHGLMRDYPGSFAEWESQRSTRQQEAARAAAALEEERREREKRASKRRHADEKADRATLRTRQRAVEERAAEVERLEAQIAAVQAQLADASLYADGAGALRGTQLKQDLDKLEAALVQALHEWHEAAEAMR